MHKIACRWTVAAKLLKRDFQINFLFFSHFKFFKFEQKKMVSTWAIFPAGGKFVITRGPFSQGTSFALFLGGSTTCLLGQIAFKLSYFAIVLFCTAAQTTPLAGFRMSPLYRFFNILVVNSFFLLF